MKATINLPSSKALETVYLCLQKNIKPGKSFTTGDIANWLKSKNFGGIRYSVDLLMALGVVVNKTPEKRSGCTYAIVKFLALNTVMSALKLRRQSTPIKERKLAKPPATNVKKSPDKIMLELTIQVNTLDQSLLSTIEAYGHVVGGVRIVDS